MLCNLHYNKNRSKTSPFRSQMAEVNDGSKVQSQYEFQFVEVNCKSSGKIRRFSIGTEANFAVKLINNKLVSDDASGDGNIPMASYIEAVKENEDEPVSFGPNSLLVNYGPGWKLQTVVDSIGAVNFQRTKIKEESSEGDLDFMSIRTSLSPVTPFYLGKIAFAFVLLFVFGAFFTLALENLPRFILFLNPSL